MADINKSVRNINTMESYAEALQKSLTKHPRAFKPIGPDSNPNLEKMEELTPPSIFVSKLEYQFPVDSNITEEITYNGSPNIWKGPNYVANIENVKEALDIPTDEAVIGVNETPGPLPDELKTIMENNSKSLEEMRVFEQPTPLLTPEQEKALYTDEEKERAAAAVSSNPVEVVKAHTRGRRKKEETSDTTTSPSPANNESNINKE